MKWQQFASVNPIPSSQGIKSTHTKKSTAMFFFHFLLFSTISEIYAMTTQHAEQHDLNPLILPLFGKPHYLYMKSWQWVGNDRQSITSAGMVLRFDYSHNEISQDSYDDDTKNIVFGSWEYVDVGAGSPSSALTFAKDETVPQFRDFSYWKFTIGKDSASDTYLGRLLRQFDKKMISFWWDTRISFWDFRGPKNPIAELAIGGVNPSRFVAGTEMRVQLSPSSYLSWYLEPITGTAVRVRNINMNWNKNIQFAFDTESSIPIVIYDAITKPLRDEMRYTVGLMKGMPQDTNMRIMQYLDLNEHISRFDCKDAKKLLPLHIGELTIPPSMMYRQISAGKCEMTLRRNSDELGQSRLLIGIDLIRHFYFSIIYDFDNGNSLQFAKRVKGDAPPPPTGPPVDLTEPQVPLTEPPVHPTEPQVPPTGPLCEASRSPTSKTKKSANKCCVIS